ncbi:phage portal protein [Aquimarina sp. AU119]|uniref:phage portal protein n=1 Tax=Aquimarina sp. AU119 TaxID=2108528 RepID=UPI000D693402|nr:phage portal protein [Aquimarina sp. AU119]
MEEESILQLIIDQPYKAIQELKKDGKNYLDIEKYKSEYKDLDRKIRPSQIGNIQKDKVVGKGESRKIVQAVRTIVNLQRKIINTATAFEFGKPVKLIPNEDNELSKLILKTWKSTRIDSKLQKAKIQQKSETESSVLFYISGEGEARKMRSKVLKSDEGKMYPYFDSEGDMIYFVWQFKHKNGQKTIDNHWIYDKDKVYKLSTKKTGKMMLDNSIDHGFDKIPIVYMSQDQVEYEDVKSLIDRYEVTLSKLGASNDYTGHPILFIEGEVQGMPDKDSDGKALRTSVEFDDSGNKISGNAKFLTHDNAPESVKLEIETIKELIYSLTSTPDLSFENLKGIGNISGVALELMFLDPIIKALMNEGENRTIVERCINIITSGLITTIKTSLKSQNNNLLFEVSFDSILPNNLQEMVNTLSKGVTDGIISKKTAVEKLALTADNEIEFNQLSIPENNNN